MIKYQVIIWTGSAIKVMTYRCQLTLIGGQLQAERTVKQLHITIAVIGWLNDKIPGNYKDR